MRRGLRRRCDLRKGNDLALIVAGADEAAGYLREPPGAAATTAEVAGVLAFGRLCRYA
jgi:hypothetical protein